MFQEVATDLNGAGFDAPDGHLSRTVVRLDERGRTAVVELLYELLGWVNDLAQASETRDHSETIDVRDVEVVLMSFQPAER